jgi:DNA-directed RNA polymerase specialized sigma24 family protein
LPQIMAITALSDAELLDQARGGDEAAFTELYVRHQAAARRLASTYKRVGDPDDLVNGAFERVLGALRRGAGPTESFRAYLFVTLRRLAAEQGQKPADQAIEDVPEPVGDEADEPGLGSADRELITKAFESLPDR